MNKLSNVISKSARLEWPALLATFPKHSGNPYKQSDALMELWPAWGGLYVTLYSAVVLNKNLCC